MPGIARGNGVDTVHSETGTGRNCSSPVDTTTGECSSDVFVNGTGVVRQGDKVFPHNKSGCSTDESVITDGSSTVFVNGKAVARLGDHYTSDNTITSASGDVIAG